MNIKKRLIISNTITILIPVLVTFLSAAIFLNVSLKIFNKRINYNNLEKLTFIKAEIINSSKDLLYDGSEASKDKLYENLSKRLSTINGKFIITKEGNALLQSKDINMFDAQKCIEDTEKQQIQTIVKINDVSYIVELSDFKYKDGTDGSIILLMPAGGSIDIVKQLISVILITFTISAVIVNIVTSYLLSKGIVEPINLLKKAASEISSGNLNCEIIEDGDSEIEELCRDFEKMRVQLKDSVHVKLKYDDDRKMLVSSISHDLKTPITSIKGYVEGILDGVANTDEKRNRYLKTIYMKSEQMDGMIDDLLLYSKLDMNQVPFNFRKTDIVEFFKYCIDESALELNKDNIEISLTNDLKEPQYVMMDMERMRRVIVNIIDNSHKYINKKDGMINIKLRETELSIVIEIRDNGSGIDKSDIGNIFDRFYRADSARSGVKGSGLGLAIAKQIVEGHEGRIWAISHGSEGTSILISLAKLMG